MKRGKLGLEGESEFAVRIGAAGSLNEIPFVLIYGKIRSQKRHMV